MTSLAILLQKFFTDWLLVQKQVSGNTISSYRDSIRLLLEFASIEKRSAPTNLKIEVLDADMIGRFLAELEVKRGNSARTRNARLAAIRSFFAFVALSDPALVLQSQRILAMPSKRFDRPSVSYLDQTEIEYLLSAPDRSTWIGRRDYALLLLGLRTGLRVSELAGLVKADISIGAGAHVRCVGKGRKERSTPLQKSTVDVIVAWLNECGGDERSPLFPTKRGARLSRDAIERIVKRHCSAASLHCGSLAAKRVSPHTLRHSAAMTLLQSGIDPTVLALWLGHESIETTQIYVHADLQLKQRALARVAEPGASLGSFKASDSLIAFLNGL